MKYVKLDFIEISKEEQYSIFDHEDIRLGWEERIRNVQSGRSIELKWKNKSFYCRLNQSYWYKKDKIDNNESSSR